MIFSYIEVIIPIPIPIPGIKLGLANIVIVLVLYMFEIKDAIIISIIRIVLVSITFGNLSMMLYSLAGAVLSLLFMILFKKSGLFSVIGVSAVGGLFHNIGQLILATIVIESVNMLYYAPILIISGTITGVLIGILAKSILAKVKGSNR